MAAFSGRTAPATASLAQRMMSGVVAGQDTPVAHAADIPDNVKKDYTSGATEHPEGFDEAERSAKHGGSGESGGSGALPEGPHPGPAEDPYSGEDPNQQKTASSQPSGS